MKSSAYFWEVMKNILKILCVVSASSVFVMIVFNRANSNELPAKDQQQSKHEYVISPDDSVLTYIARAENIKNLPESIDGKLWYEAVNHSLKNGFLRDSKQASAV